MVRSMLVHCSPVWAPQSIGLLDRLEAAQKRCVKWIFNTSYLVRWSSNFYHSQLANIGLVPIDVFFKINDLKLFYRIVHKLVCVELPHYLRFAQPHDFSYTTRSNRDIVGQLDVTRIICSITTPTSRLRDSFFFRCYVLWNTIPCDIRQAPSYLTFCKQIRNFLFNPQPTDGTQ